MLQLLGIGVPGSDGDWLLHRVCAKFEDPGFAVVVSSRADERKTLLDVVAGRLIPSEGRLWVDGVPSIRGTGGRIRQLVSEIELPALLTEHRSVLWNVLVQRISTLRALGSLHRLPGLARREAAMRALRLVELDGRHAEPVSALDPETAARVSLARGLLPGPRYLVIREPDHSLGDADLERFLARVALVARHERLTVLASMSPTSLARHVGTRVLALADGLLVFDGTPDAFSRSARWTALSGSRSAPGNA